MTVLMLNADCQPLNVLPLSVCTWKEAFAYIFDGKVDVLAEYDDWDVHSPAQTYKVPAVVRLTHYTKIKPEVCYNRYNLYLRDEFACQYCGERFTYNTLTVDHVIPRRHGGRTTWSNCVAACQACNAEKAHYLDMVPRHKPRRPDVYELIDKRKKFPIKIYHESWVDFMGWSDPSLLVKRYSEAKTMKHFKGCTR